jgi:hypothetical protein
MVRGSTTAEEDGRVIPRHSRDTIEKIEVYDPIRDSRLFFADIDSDDHQIRFG